MSSPVDDVRHANQGFYRAFESLSLARMEEVWAHDGQVTCVHPGSRLSDGWAAVRESWRAIFHHQGEIAIRATDERIDVRGELAWVLCIERVSVGGQNAGAVLATNVFRREGERWRMVHHHASPIPASPPPPPPVPTSRGPGGLPN